MAFDRTLILACVPPSAPVVAAVVAAMVGVLASLCLRDESAAQHLRDLRRLLRIARSVAVRGSCSAETEWILTGIVRQLRPSGRLQPTRRVGSAECRQRAPQRIWSGIR